MSQALTITRQANALMPTNITDAMHLAEFMSRARTVPKHLQDSPGDCLMVVEQAMRWGMSPFAVAQATSVISGKLMYEGKLVAAAVESSGAIVGHLAYDFTGEGDGRTITVAATRRGETNPRTVTVAFKDARTNNEMWKRQPDQQLVYHGARVWARRWTPAVILGVYSREEMAVIIDGEVEDATPPPTQRDQINADVPLKAAAASTPRGARIAERAPAYEASPKPERTDDQWRAWLDKLAAACSTLYSRSDVADLGGKATVGDALATGPQWVQAEISKILAENYARFPEEDQPEEPDPDLEIVGEKYAAG